MARETPSSRRSLCRYGDAGGMGPCGWGSARLYWASCANSPSVPSSNAPPAFPLGAERIRNLTEHLKVHKKDNHTRRGLMMLIGKRRGMLKYIKNRNIDEYRELIKKLGIRDNI